MDKLIELLNEYNKEIGKPKRMSGREVRAHYSWVICSGYGFIEWLVQNNKIELSKLEKIGREETVCMYDGQYIKTVEYPDYKRVLMILSIQGNPIEFLISILK